MSKLTQSLVKDLPSYLSLIQEQGQIKESPEVSVNRLIEKINKYNGGME